MRFPRAKAKNRARLEGLESAGRLNVLLKSQVQKIDDEYAQLETSDGQLELANDRILICAGGVLPDGMLRDMGIQVAAKYGTA